MKLFPTLGTEPLKMGDLVTLRPYGGKDKSGVVVAVDEDGGATIEWTLPPTQLRALSPEELAEGLWRQTETG